MSLIMPGIAPCNIEFVDMVVEIVCMTAGDLDRPFGVVAVDPWLESEKGRLTDGRVGFEVVLPTGIHEQEQGLDCDGSFEFVE